MASLDPKMKVLGPYDYSDKGELNFLFRFGYRFKHIEYSVFLETFDAIGYRAYGLNANYFFLLEDSKRRFNQWELGLGPGIGIVDRKKINVEGFFFEVNGEVRYFFNKHLGISLLENLKHRTDLVIRYNEKRPLRLSGFLGIIYRW
ncbi:hypothetical protein [Flavicella sp.]|uniref:hypothetical protein n=1 Tax=Flavicella sp. TaxID=2957742 RepID=UPI0030160AE9